MGVLDRFEKGIERAVNGAFAKAFRSEVQPVEIASALRREVDDKAAIVGRDRTIVPNLFVVELGKADHDRLGQWVDALGDELSAVISDHAKQQRYAFVGPVSVGFEEAQDLDTGVFRVRSQTARRDGAPAGHPHADAASGQPANAAPAAGRAGGPAPAAPPFTAPPVAPPYAPAPGNPAPQPSAAAPPPYEAPPFQAPPFQAPPFPAQPYEAPPPSSGAAQPAPAQPQWSASAPTVAAAPAVPPSLDVDGHRYEITSAVTVIGRGTDADVVLDDPGASRRHAEVHLLDGKARVIDLGSTNGTFVDGDRVPVGTLHEGSTITIGRTRIVYHPGNADPSLQRGQGQW